MHGNNQQAAQTNIHDPRRDTHGTGSPLADFVISEPHSTLVTLKELPPGICYDPVTAIESGFCPRCAFCNQVGQYVIQLYPGAQVAEPVEQGRSVAARSQLPKSISLIWCYFEDDVQTSIADRISSWYSEGTRRAAQGCCCPKGATREGPTSSNSLEHRAHEERP